MNKSTTVNVTTPLYWPEDDALEELAKRLGVPKAGALRIGLFELLKVHFPAKAKELTRARINHKVASYVCLAFMPFVIWSAANGAEIRRSNSTLRISRTGREIVFEEGV